MEQSRNRSGRCQGREVKRGGELEGRSRVFPPRIPGNKGGGLALEAR